MTIILEATKDILARHGRRMPDHLTAAIAMIGEDRLVVTRPIDEHWQGSSASLLHFMAEDQLRDGPVAVDLVAWDCDADAGGYWLVQGATLIAQGDSKVLIFEHDGERFAVDIEENLMALSV